MGIYTSYMHGYTVGTVYRCCGYSDPGTVSIANYIGLHGYLIAMKSKTDMHAGVHC